MPDVLPDRVTWYVAGPLLGLLVAGLYALANKPLGATGSYVQTLHLVRARAATETWRVWYFGGLLLGGFLVAMFRGGVDVRGGYPTLSDATGALLVPVLLLAGVTMGYGARMAGGCTSGHGICGTSARSAASWVSTATFMATAVTVTAVLGVITGGEL